MGNVHQMTSMDAAWLHMDRPTNLMIVNSVFWFDRSIDWDRVREAFAERLVPTFPRFAQRAVEPPVTVGLLQPRWKDVEGFDVEDHLRRTELPAPGSDDDLHAYVSEQAALPLDASRPLWEAHLIDGYRDGCAVLLRTHHAIADGMALVQALLTLADDPPEGAHAGQLPIAAGAQAGENGLTARNVFSLLRRPLQNGSNPTSLRSRAVEGLRQVSDFNAVLRRLGFARADDDTPLRGVLSGRKHLTWSRAIPLAPVKEIGRRAGATVNDLALTAVTGALRQYLQHHGHDPGRLTVAVPVNLRPTDQPMDPERGNQFGLAFVRLPVAEPDVEERLAAVDAAMDRAKSTGEGVVTAGGISAMGHVPVAVEQAWLDLFVGRATAIITNIAGPREEVSLAGVPLQGFMAWVPSTGPVGIGLSICSYAGNLLLGVSVDEELIPDSELLLEFLAEEVQTLSRLSG